MMTEATDSYKVVSIRGGNAVGSNTVSHGREILKNTFP